MKFQLFGLLHLAENEENATNVSISDFQEHVAVYVDNAITLAKSLQLKGIEFTLLTNNKALVEKCARRPADGFVLQVIEIPFITQVPSGIRFYSAHFKIDAYRHLARLGEGYFGLCDIDVVCINEIPQSLKTMIYHQIPVCYDISDQVIPAYGADVILRDMSVIGGIESEGRWMGGEFLAGPSAFFADLVKEIDTIYPDYVANIPTLHHIGDEALTSAGIERLRRQGRHVADAGTLLIIGRYWSGNVSHHQRPFDHYKNCFLLHLPSDKKFLSGVAILPKEDIANFSQLYEKKMRSPSAKLVRGLKAVAKRLKSKT